MSKTADAEFEIRQQIAKIRDTQAALDAWTEANEDICGYDDATWYDTIASFNEEIADAGMVLADLIEKLMGLA